MALMFCSQSGQTSHVYVLVRLVDDGSWLVSMPGDAGAAFEHPRRMDEPEFLLFVTSLEPRAPRWVWEDTARIYPRLLDQGIRVHRCHDLRLCHVIIKNSALTKQSALARAAPNRWDVAAAAVEDAESSATLFDLTSDDDDLEAVLKQPDGDAGPGTESSSIAGEFGRQLAALAGAQEPARLRLLLAAECAGALVAAEMRHAGLPWRTDVHDRLLTEQLGPRVAPGTRPARLHTLAHSIRVELDDPKLNPDSPQELLRALQRAGLSATSTRSGELAKLTHPVVEPLLQYKKLSRLQSANGWTWMDSWVIDGRFHPDYVPGGVVTGRWATRGGGALQLPKQIRGAVVADYGWKFVVADAAQLEPRILAALAHDTAMAEAGHKADLYSGIVSSGVVATRNHAKLAMLGAMYGATTGESGRLLPQLARAYPRAIALTEEAARAGERGEVVTTRLGRSSPRPGVNWLNIQAKAYEPSATAADERRARREARDWGRFTRNFIVQGTAAEWALCWLAEIRRELAALPAGPLHRDEQSARGARAPFASTPHLVFFLHDEVIVHTPSHQVDAVSQIIAAAADTAGRLLFADFPVDFMLTMTAVDNYAEAQ